MTMDGCHPLNASLQADVEGVCFSSGRPQPPGQQVTLDCGLLTGSGGLIANILNFLRAQR